MGSWNMPPGVSVTDIPGYNDPDPPFYPNIRCKCCGCWIGYTYPFSWVNYKIVDPVEQKVKYENLYCPGRKYSYTSGPNDYIPNKTFHEEMDVGICGEVCDGPHTFDEYAGTTSWYRCNHCGAETPIEEF